MTRRRLAKTWPLALCNSRLSRRIVLWIFMSLTVIEALMLVPSLERERQDILAQIKEVSWGKVIWILMTYPEATGEELLEHVRDLQRNPMLSVIVGGAVYQDDGGLIGTFGESPEIAVADLMQGGYLYSRSKLGDRYEASWTADQPEGRYHIVIRHDAGAIRPELRAFVFRSVAQVLLVSALVTLAMMAILRPVVIAPILKLRGDLRMAGEAICENGPEPEFRSCDIERRDELGDVIGTFFCMFAQIREAVHERLLAERELRQSNERMRRYLDEVNKVTAAVIAMEEGVFQAESLTSVAARRDELGGLARVFQTMAEEIKEREDRLRQKVVEQQIEIDHAKLARQVTEITSSGYFQDLLAQLDQVRYADGAA